MCARVCVCVRERVEHWFNAHSTLEKGEKIYYFKRKSEIEKRWKEKKERGKRWVGGGIEALESLTSSYEGCTQHNAFPSLLKRGWMVPTYEWKRKESEWVSEWASVFCNKPPCIASQPFLNIYSLLRFASSQSIYIYWLYLCALFSIFLSISFPFLYLFLFNFLAHRLWSVYADVVFFFVFRFSVFLFFCSFFSR